MTCEFDGEDAIREAREIAAVLEYSLKCRAAGDTGDRIIPLGFRERSDGTLEAYEVPA